MKQVVKVDEFPESNLRNGVQSYYAKSLFWPKLGNICFLNICIYIRMYYRVCLYNMYTYILIYYMNDSNPILLISRLISRLMKYHNTS